MKTSETLKPSIIKTRAKAFVYALEGLRAALKREQPLRFHLFFFCLAIAGGLFLDLTNFEWMLVLICSGFVVASELFNSAIEAMCDMMMPHNHSGIKYIKDVSAGAVLLSAITAVAVAALIVLQHSGSFL